MHINLNNTDSIADEIPLFNIPDLSLLMPSKPSSSTPRISNQVKEINVSPIVENEILLDEELRELSDAYKRLQGRIQLYGFREFKIPGDGQCQFSSIAHQLFNNSSRAGEVRKNVMQQIQSNPEYYIEFIEDESFISYVWRMSQTATWGDHVTLQAAADYYHVTLNVITSYSDQPFLEIKPQGEFKKENAKNIWLSFHGEFHYNSLVY